MMGKLKCPCGFVIVDQTDNNPFKASLIRDNLIDDISDSITENIDSLVDANNSNKKEEWIKANFSVPPYPTNLKDSSIIHDFMVRELIEVTQDVFQCENCSRIAIQIGQSNEFKFFSPDSENSDGLFS
jgi:hypothetical protein